MTNPRPPVRRKRKATDRRPVDQAELEIGFYAEAIVDAAEQVAMKSTKGFDTLEGELANLRVQLRRIMRRAPKREAKQDANLKLMLRTTDMVNRLTSTRYRIGKKAQKELADNVAALIQGFRSEMGLGENDGT
jgi:hypothetical protein